MADDNQLAEATQALSFAEFLERMKDPQAANLVRSIKNFIKTFDDKPANPERDADSVQAFLAKSEGTFRDHPVWANVPVEHQSQAMEGLEKYLMTKIFYKTFAQSELDRERDAALTQRMAALNFVQPHHLDIPQQYQTETSAQLAIKELHKINNYKAPRDKLVCVLNCCRVINNLLHVAGGNSHEARGADDFLPVLIYVVIHANPPQLASNLEYIQRFRMHSRMVSESAYFFTQLYSAASFIETINSSSLTMDSDEFVARMIAAGVPDIEAASTQPPSPKVKADPHPGSPKAGAALIPSAPEDNLGLPNQPSQPSLANTPNKDPGTAPAKALSTSADPQQPNPPSPGTYAAIATPFEGGSHSLLPPTPSIRGDPSAALMSAPDPPPAPVAATLPAQSEAPEPQQTQQAEPWPSVADLEQEGVAQLLQAEASGQLQQQYTYLYASAMDLRIDDIPVLLKQYKELILKHEALVAAIAAHRAQQQQQSSGATTGIAQEGGSQAVPSAITTTLSSQPQASPLQSGTGSGASPFSQASAQAALSGSLDTARPSAVPSGQQASTSQVDHDASHRSSQLPAGAAANSPFEQANQQNGASGVAGVGQQGQGGHLFDQSASRSGMDAVGSTHSDGQVRNSLTAASQPLPPEASAEIDDRHVTMSSGAALDEAVESENAGAPRSGSRSPAAAGESQSPLGSVTSIGGKGEASPAGSTTPTEGVAKSSASGAAPSDMFAGLDVGATRTNETS